MWPESRNSLADSKERAVYPRELSKSAFASLTTGSSSTMDIKMEIIRRFLRGQTHTMQQREICTQLQVTTSSTSFCHNAPDRFEFNILWLRRPKCPRLFLCCLADRSNFQGFIFFQKFPGCPPFSPGQVMIWLPASS